jgi:hypothetical protein
VGRPHDVKGESVFAFVVCRGERPTGDVSKLVDELRKWVSQELGAIARPDDIRFADNLPKTRSGKIMRRLLRTVARGDEITQDVSTLENPAILDQLRGVDADGTAKIPLVKRRAAGRGPAKTKTAAKAPARQAVKKKTAVKPKRTAAKSTRAAPGAKSKRVAAKRAKSSTKAKSPKKGKSPKTAKVPKKAKLPKKASSRRVPARKTSRSSRPRRAARRRGG